MKTTTLFTLGALGTLAAAMATPAHAEEKKEERRIVIKIDGKDMSIPEAASHAIDKAMAALDSALASKELATVNAEEIRESIRKAIDEANAHGVVINRRSASDAVEKNNPYSAREVREFKQTLADGTLIQRQSTRLLARDREGRLRQELRQADGSARVFINDPVDKAAYIIDPQKKTACRAEFNERAINDCYSQIKGDWKPLGFMLHANSRSGLGMMSARDDIAIEVSPRAQIIDLTRKAYVHRDGKTLEAPVPPTPPLPPLPPLAGMRSDSGGNAQVSREKKTGQSYEGLQVDADRTVETIAAGAIGNSRPIESVVERYYSPELKMTVFSRRSDPRNGESIYRMVDIKRSEPDAALFRVPAGYNLSEGKK